MTLIWEMYEIHPTLPSKVSCIGHWNAKQGIQFEEPRKWIRRQNLEVCKEMQNSSKTVLSYLFFISGSKIQYPKSTRFAMGYGNEKKIR